MDLVECTSQTDHYTLDTSIMARLKEKELLFLQMDLITTGISITTVQSLKTVNSIPKLFSILEDSRTIILKDKVLKLVKVTFSKANSIMDQELKELLSGTMILVSIQEVSTNKINSTEKVTNILFR